jgi:hypothetical protein
MKRKFFLTMFIAVALSLSAIAETAFGMDKDASRLRPAFGIQDWLSSASAKWQISFPYETRFAKTPVSAPEPRAAWNQNWTSAGPTATSSS